jgi:hypothetical protein
VKTVDSGYRDTGRFVFSIALLVLFMLPLSTYALFREEVQLDFFTLVATLLAIAIGVASVQVLILRFTPRAIVVALEVLLTLSVLLFVYNFYAEDYGGKVIGADADVFDGNYTKYEFFLFATVSIIFSIFYKKLGKYFKNVTIFLALISAGNLVPLVAGDEQAEETGDESPLDSSGYLAFSTDKNVIHIILDGMQGTYFSRMLATDSSFQNNFPGFTFFPDALTSSEVTYLAIPSVFSGQAWDGVGSIRAYKMRSGILPQSDKGKEVSASFLSDLSSNQFLIQVLSVGGSSMGEMSFYDEYFSTDFLNDKGLDANPIWRLLDLTLIKVMPWQVKRDVYRDGDWLFSGFSQGSQLPRANRAFHFLDRYSRKITANSSRPTYKSLHLLSPHAPWTTGEDCAVTDAQKDNASRYTQARCIMLGVGEFLRALQKIGVYEQSLIVIHGDHGICDPGGLPLQRKDNPNIPQCVGNTNPLIMLKPLGGRTELHTRSSPVELTDIAPTILDLLSIAHEYKGVNVFDDNKTRSRTRHFYKFSPNRAVAVKQDKVDETIRFEVKGPITESSSWCRPSLDNCEFNQ